MSDNVLKFLVALWGLDASHRGGAGGQAFTEHTCTACHEKYVAGSTASGGLLCRRCRGDLRWEIDEEKARLKP
jgi:hypothetical protein